MLFYVWQIILLLLSVQWICNVNGQDWLIDQIIPPDYDPEEAPLRPDVDHGTILVNGRITVNHFHASYNQMV